MAGGGNKKVCHVKGVTRWLSMKYTFSCLFCGVVSLTISWRIPPAGLALVKLITNQSYQSFPWYFAKLTKQLILLTHQTSRLLLLHRDFGQMWCIGTNEIQKFKCVNVQIMVDD